MKSLIIIEVTLAHALYLHNDYGNRIKKKNKRLYDVHECYDKED